MTDGPRPNDRGTGLIGQIRRRLAIRPDERVVLGAMGAVVGAGSGLAAVGLARLLHHAEELLAGAREQWFSPALPALGVVAAVLLVRVLLADSGGHGVPEIIDSVSRRGGRMPLRLAVSRLLGSALTIAGGGSVGPEAPVAVGGAAIGSNLGDLFHTNERQRIALVGSGAAGAIAAIFNAPVAGIVFSLEVILAEWSAIHIVPVALASVTGTVVSHVLQGNQVPFEHRAFDVTGPGLLAVVGLAAVTAAGSLLFVRLLRGGDWLAQRLGPNIWLRAVAGGLLVGAIGIAVPQVLGESYEVVRESIGETAQAGLAWVALAVLAKMVASSITLSTGGVGGVFAPSLVVGSLLGLLYHRGLIALGVGPGIGGEGLYSLLGMAGVLSGVLQAPLTAFFLISDITGGYFIIVPLLLVAAATAAFVHHFEAHSVYLRELVERGELLRPRTDARILTDLRMSEVVDREVPRIEPHLSLATLLEQIGSARQDVVPVVDADGRYLGVVDLVEIRPYLVDPAMCATMLVEDLLDASVEPLSMDSNVREVALRFSRTPHTAIPVAAADGQLVGIVDKARLFELYRRELIVQET